MRGSICQTKLVSASKMEDLVKNFSSSVSESWSTLRHLLLTERGEALSLLRVTVKHGWLGGL